jgi:pimeloyl-[acyl-carrier protein] methyl ester esterase
VAERRATLVLLPGLDGTAIFFRPLVAALPPWIGVHCVEYPVSGANDYRALFPLVRDTCLACDDFFVLGWSFSGPLALMLATQAPERLRGVILGASFIAPPWPFLRLLRVAITAPVVRIMPVLSQALALIGRYSSAEFRRDRRECLSRVPLSVFAARTRAVLDTDLRPGLTCNVPLLYIAGSSDIVVPRWNARAVMRAVPSTRVVTIDGPHLALYTNPAKAAEVITRFIEAHAAA